VVGEAEGGEEILALIEALVPDVAVLDCKLPGLSGPEIAAAIRNKGLPVRVLMLSAYTDDAYVYGALEAGAVGYLLKEEAPETIVAAVRAAVRGEGYFSPPVASKVAAWARGERPGGLTEREVEVLQLMAKGLSNKEIAQTLSVTVRTVDFHVSNILKKLEVTSRVEAAVWAKEQGVAS
jgi:DNA-binding NarL/FixJ family response regulator